MLLSSRKTIVIYIQCGLMQLVGSYTISSHVCNNNILLSNFVMLFFRNIFIWN